MKELTCRIRGIVEPVGIGRGPPENLAFRLEGLRQSRGTRSPRGQRNCIHKCSEVSRQSNESGEGLHVEVHQLPHRSVGKLEKSRLTLVYISTPNRIQIVLAWEFCRWCRCETSSSKEIQTFRRTYSRENPREIGKENRTGLNVLREPS